MSNLNKLINNGMLKYADKKGVSIEKLPFTNADKIRSMSDEELAEFIDIIASGCSDDCDCETCFIYELGYCGGKSTIDWLNSEFNE